MDRTELLADLADFKSAPRFEVKLMTVIADAVIPGVPPHVAYHVRRNIRVDAKENMDVRASMTGERQ